jgi:hypothetical protein
MGRGTSKVYILNIKTLADEVLEEIVSVSNNADDHTSATFSPLKPCGQEMSRII